MEIQLNRDIYFVSNFSVVRLKTEALPQRGD
jgi:hypothetical protein